MRYADEWATNEILTLLLNNEDHYELAKTFDYFGQFEEYCEENPDYNLSKARFGEKAWNAIDWLYICEYFTDEEEI